MTDLDPFAELGLSPEAEPEIVKAAFKALAKKYHPDKFSDPREKAEAERKMARINEAQRMILNGYRPPPPDPPQQTRAEAAPPPFKTSPPEPSSQSGPRTNGSRPPVKKEPLALALVGAMGLLTLLIFFAWGQASSQHLAKALDFEKAGEYQRALQELNKAVRKTPENRSLYGHRARIWRALGEKEKALVDEKNSRTPTFALPQDASASPSPRTRSKGS